MWTDAFVTVMTNDSQSGSELQGQKLEHLKTGEGVLRQGYNLYITHGKVKEE